MKVIKKIRENKASICLLLLLPLTAVGVKANENMIVNPGETKTIGGNVEGDIIIHDGELHITPKSIVTGDITSTGLNSKIDINQGKINGRIHAELSHGNVIHELNSTTRVLSIDNTTINTHADNSISLYETDLYLNHSEVFNQKGSGVYLYNQSNITLDQVIKDSRISVESDFAILGYGTNMDINGTKIFLYDSGTQAALRLFPCNSIASMNFSTIVDTIIQSNSSGAEFHNSQVKASVTKIIAQNTGISLHDSYLDIENSNITAKNTGIFTHNSELNIQNSYITGGIYVVDKLNGQCANNQLTIDNTSIESNGKANITISSQQYEGGPSDGLHFDNDFDSDSSFSDEDDYMTHITLRNNTRLVGHDDQPNRVIINAIGNTPVVLNLEDSTISGVIKSRFGTDFNFNLKGDALFKGYTYPINHVTLDKASSWIITGNSTVQHMDNAGEITFSGVDNENNESYSLFIHKKYTGQNGSITFNSILGGDDSSSNKFIIYGDTAGETNVHVNNIGGTGDATLNGIELIHVDGLSDGHFKQSGRITAGAYDYTLVRGENEQTRNWYLTSRLVPPATVKQPIVRPVDGMSHHPATDSEPETVNSAMTPPETTAINQPASLLGTEMINRPVIRPEAATYIANLSAANTLFMTTMNDRVGKNQYTDLATGEKKISSLWLRQLGGHNHWHDDSGQLKTRSKSYVTQLGGDIAQWSTNHLNSGHIGLMAGYGRSHNQTLSSVTHYHSKGSIHGYSIGAYATWFANAAERTGPYVDSWLQYNWFNHQVQGQGLAKETYSSRGLTASVEAGYTIKMREFSTDKKSPKQLFIQPQVQVTSLGVKADNHRETNHTHVTSKGKNHFQTRLGIRTYLKGHHAIDKDNLREFEPFIEANWVHNSRKFSAKMDGTRIAQDGARHVGEVKVGIASRVNAKVSLWGNIGSQIGNKGYNNNVATLGIKYSF